MNTNALRTQIYFKEFLFSHHRGMDHDFNKGSQAITFTVLEVQANDQRSQEKVLEDYETPLRYKY